MCHWYLPPLASSTYAEIVMTVHLVYNRWWQSRLERCPFFRRKVHPSSESLPKPMLWNKDTASIRTLYVGSVVSEIYPEPEVPLYTYSSMCNLQLWIDSPLVVRWPPSSSRSGEWCCRSHRQCQLQLRVLQSDTGSVFDLSAQSMMKYRISTCVMVQ